MKFRFLAAAGAALAIGSASPSHAAGSIQGYYLATFFYPGGNFSHCFALTQTNSYPGYTSSGTWTITDLPTSAGSYVVYKRAVHLAGSIPVVAAGGGTDYVAFDGQISNGQLINTTFDIFTPQGVYYAAGNFIEQRDATCSGS